MVGIEYPDEDERDTLRTDGELSLLSPPEDYDSDISLDELGDPDDE
jgi:hypothetical protein